MIITGFPMTTGTQNIRNCLWQISSNISFDLFHSINYYFKLLNKIIIHYYFISLTTKGVCKWKKSINHCRHSKPLFWFLTQDIVVCREISLVNEDFKLPPSYTKCLQQQQIIVRSICFCLNLKHFDLNLKCDTSGDLVTV